MVKTYHYLQEPIKQFLSNLGHTVCCSGYDTLIVTHWTYDEPSISAIVPEIVPAEIGEWNTAPEKFYRRIVSDVKFRENSNIEVIASCVYYDLDWSFRHSHRLHSIHIDLSDSKSLQLLDTHLRDRTARCLI